MVGTVINKPLVSTIIPVFNAERYLTEALESVVNQTWEAHEIILVDDGSTDSTARIANQFGTRLAYAHQPNKGTAAARNRGVEMAAGEYFAFLDADDVWTGDKLTVQIAAFCADPELDIVFGHVQQFFSPELDGTLREKLHCAPEPIRGVLPSTMMVKRDAFFRVGSFDSKWHLGEWSNWYVHAVEIGLKMQILTEVLAHRRLHEGNKGIVQGDQRTEYPRLLKASLDRRRQKPV